MPCATECSKNWHILVVCLLIYGSYLSTHPPTYLRPGLGSSQGLAAIHSARRSAVILSGSDGGMPLLCTLEWAAVAGVSVEKAPRGAE